MVKYDCTTADRCKQSFLKSICTADDWCLNHRFPRNCTIVAKPVKRLTCITRKQFGGCQSEGQSKSFQLAEIAVLFLGTRDACPNCINRALLLRIILRKAVKQLIGFGTATFVR